MTLLSVDQSSELGAVSRATETEVLLAAGTLGTALRETPAFVRLHEAGAGLSVDDAAQEAIEAFNRCRADLQIEIRLGTLDADQRAEIERLQSTMLGFPTLAEYLAAQAEFEEICRETAGLVTGEIGIDFAANCRAGGCCGG
jgi:cell fate (sporulation/competence/biofilm development) regulator YlbF (YheA/YmcA/DUF963 family)